MCGMKTMWICTVQCVPYTLNIIFKSGMTLSSSAKLQMLSDIHETSRLLDPSVFLRHTGYFIIFFNDTRTVLYTVHSTVYDIQYSHAVYQK